jgi:hypothetical protein
MSLYLHSPNAMLFILIHDGSRKFRKTATLQDEEQLATLQQLF